MEKKLKGNPLDWLLQKSSPEVRYLALRDLQHLPHDDHELTAARKEAHQTGPIHHVLEKMDAQGFWVGPGAGYSPKYRSNVWSLLLLAQLGASIREDERIEKACHYYLDHALAPGGQIAHDGNPSGTFDCLQGNMCWALTEMEFRDDRLAQAYEWMALSVTGEGVAPAIDRSAVLRYYAYKCAPRFACGANNKMPCAWGAVKVMRAFGNLPKPARTPMIEKAIAVGVDFLLGSDPAKADYPSGLNDHPSRNWWKFGFPLFYVTDILQIAEALVSLGFGKDARLANTFDLILEKQNADGSWNLEYDYSGKTWKSYGKLNQPNKWVTLRAMRVLNGMIE